jgi:hypothetical protein
MLIERPCFLLVSAVAAFEDDIEILLFNLSEGAAADKPFFTHAMHDGDRNKCIENARADWNAPASDLGQKGLLQPPDGGRPSCAMNKTFGNDVFIVYSQLLI